MHTDAPQAPSPPVAAPNPPEAPASAPGPADGPLWASCKTCRDGCVVTDCMQLKDRTAVFQAAGGVFNSINCPWYEPLPCDADPDPDAGRVVGGAA